MSDNDPEVHVCVSVPTSVYPISQEYVVVVPCDIVVMVTDPWAGAAAVQSEQVKELYFIV